jgi:hypothetical protein
MYKFNILIFCFFIIALSLFLSKPKKHNFEKNRILVQNTTKDLEKKEPQEKIEVLEEKAPFIRLFNTPTTKNVRKRKPEISFDEKKEIKSNLNREDIRKKRLKYLKSNRSNGLKMTLGLVLKKPKEGRVSTLDSGPTYFIVEDINMLKNNNFLTHQQKEYFEDLPLEYKKERRAIIKNNPNITLETLESKLEKLIEEYEYIFLDELRAEQKQILKKYIDMIFQGTYNLFELQLEANKNKK